MVNLVFLVEIRARCRNFVFFSNSVGLAFVFVFRFFGARLPSVQGEFVAVSTAVRPVLFLFVCIGWSRSPTHAGHVRGEASGTSDARVCSNLRPTANPKRLFL